MPYRRINADVTEGEMRRLRDQGLSNAEIAASLGISYASVLRYIGKQNERHSPAGWAQDQPKHVNKAAEPVAKEARKIKLNIIRERVAVDGTNTYVELRYEIETAIIFRCGEHITIPLCDLPNIIKSLGDIALHADEIIRNKEATNETN